MASQYDILGAREDVELVGPTQTRAVYDVTARTKPHGVDFSARIPKSTYTAAAVAGIVGLFAAELEAAFEIAGVADLEYVQDPNAGGNLVDFIDVYVTSVSGNSSGSFRQPLSQMDPTELTPKVDGLRATLDAVEAL